VILQQARMDEVILRLEVLDDDRLGGLERAVGRTLVEEVATLASLALFLGMVAIWAQVIATL
jgi:hypothetical protein